MRAFVQYALVLILLLVASWILIPFRYGEKYPRQIGPSFDPYVRKVHQNQVNEQKPDLVLLGDSMLDPAVDAALLERLLNRKVLLIGRPGSASTLWYLIVKHNIVRARHRPQALIIFFRGTMMTVPAYRVTGRYFEQIDEFANSQDEELIQKAYLQPMNRLERLAERYLPPYGSRWRIRQEIDSRLRYTLPGLLAGCDRACMDYAMEVVFGNENMDLTFLSDAIAAADDYLYTRTALDFDAQVERSLLPDLIRLTEERGIRLVLVRMPVLRFSEPGSEPAGLRIYHQKMAAYLAQRGVIYLDYHHRSEFTPLHFDDPLHLNPAGEAIFTPLLAEDLKRTLELP